MSLLDDEDEPFVESVLRSTTREPLYDERTDSTIDGDDLPFRGKDKKDKKKLEDRRSSAKALPWSKSSTEKTPKKSRHNRTKSGSPPPVSPKGRGQDTKKQTKGSSQIHPSPNVKSQRKRYIQLGIEAGSSSEGEVDLEGDEGFLVMNQPAVSEQRDVLGTSSTASEDPKITKGTSFFEQETSEAHADAWWPQPSQTRSPPRQTYTAASGVSMDVAEAFLPHTVRSGVQATATPLLGNLNAFPSKQSSTSQLSTFGPSTDISPSSLSVMGGAAAPSQPWPPQDNTSEPDWTISDDLKQKCIQQFNDLQPTEGLLQGGEARQFFVQSKLPNQELSAIWRLADTDRDNALSEVEFCIAMKLVLMRRKGFVIPSTLPDVLQPKRPLAEKTVIAFESGSSETSSSAQPTSEPSTVEHQTVEDQILVDIGSGERDTGLLVDVEESRGPTVSPPPMEPAVARIISIDQTWDGDDDREDTALVSGQQPKSAEDPTSPSRQKPSRPAPPKPAIRRAKTVREKPNLPPRPSDRSLSPPAGQTGEAQSLLIIDSRQKSKSVRASGRSPGTSRKEYTILGDKDEVQDPDGREEEGLGGNHVRWKNNALHEDNKQNGGKERDKGHARSTSLDLNKMLLADGNSDELEGVPSAEPPKPPPKPLQRSLNSGDQNSSTPGEDGEELLAPRGRVRALSTGSIVQDDPLPMDTPTDMLLFSLSSSKPAPPPKPRRKAPVVPPNKPQRPPPPSKTTAELLHTKDKAEIQAHIRSLKENNSALTEINGHLEDKLFKLIEERVRLAKQLKALQQLQQPELQQQQEDNLQQ